MKATDFSSLDPNEVVVVTEDDGRIGQEVNGTGDPRGRRTWHLYWCIVRQNQRKIIAHLKLKRNVKKNVKGSWSIL